MSNQVVKHENQDWGLSLVDQKELIAIETDMNDLHQKTENTLKSAFIRFGDMLCEARTLIADDITFGEWRVARTPFESKQNANAAMQLSRAIAGNIITTKMIESNMGQSHLVELSRSSLIVQSEIEDMLEAGDTPTIKQIRALKKESEDRMNGTCNKGNKGTDVSTGSKNPEGQEQIGNFRDGYTIEKEKVINPKDSSTDVSPTVRSLDDQALDLVNEAEQSLGDVLQTTVDLHKLLDQLSDGDAKKQVNELRVVLKDAQDKLEELFNHIEGNMK